MSHLEQRFSRRKLLAGGAAALALPALGLTPASTPNPNKLSAPDRELHVLSVTDSGFADKVEALYPGLQQDSHFAMLAPLVLLVTLKKGPAMRAMSTHWSVTTSAGTFETVLYHYATPMSKRRNRKGRTIASAQTDILREGETRIITPFFSLSPKVYRNLQQNWFHIVKRKEPASFLASQLSRATAVHAKVDAVIFKDRRVLGEDKHHLVSRLRATRNAEHDEARAVVKLLRAGASDSEITHLLETHANVSRSPHKGSKGRYLQAKKQHAQMLLDKFNSVPRHKFKKMVVRLSRLRKTHIYKLAA